MVNPLIADFEPGGSSSPSLLGAVLPLPGSQNRLLSSALIFGPRSVGMTKRARGAEEEGLAEQLCKQIEFYFSDANLRHDDHMRGLLGPEPSLEAWTDLEHIASFAKAQRLVDAANLADNDAAARLAFVRDALKPSTVVEVSDDGKNARHFSMQRRPTHHRRCSIP